MVNIASLKMNLPENRFRGALPKIGIRPAIDGRRRGGRESLEEVTMGMAKAAAKLISENLRHPNGQAVECVIAGSTIGEVAEAAAWMRGKSYLSTGSVSMGIAGPITNADFFQEYLGMRNEYVDMSELVRQPWGHLLRPQRRGPDHPGKHPADSRVYA
jgi:L-fucose isomerase-like protein